VTPHHTWSAREIAEHAARLFATNVERFVGGRPLENVVDFALGY
jgi:phosphoglycerate dehydrogenase-like enzyme